MRLRQDSRFTRTPLYNYVDTPDGHELFFGLPPRCELCEGDEYVIHEVTEGEQLWQIASARYGNQYLWWILAQVNDLVRPWDLPVGLALKIPSKPAVARMLAS
jgi:hypothetical protein